MDKKIRTTDMLFPRDPLQNERYTQTKRKGMEKDISCTWKGKKKLGVAILISNKIDFKIKAIVRDKEEHHTMIKGNIQQEDITLVNIYTSSIGAPKYVKQILDIKGEIHRNTVLVGYFNTALTSMDRSSDRKTNKETAALNDTLHPMHLIDTYRAFTPKQQNTHSF